MPEVTRSPELASSSKPVLPWLVYGPTGVTGRLVVEEALRRGHRPLLAGRSESVRALGREYGLEAVVVPLERRAELTALLGRVSRVLHVAGPFAQTAEPMLAACLATQTPYIDVNGELDSLSAVLRCHEAAVARNIPLLTGAGFGVSAGECLALHVARQLPGALELRIAVAADNRGLSRGALLSTLDVISRGGAWVSAGRLTRGRIGHERFAASNGRGKRWITALPLAEAQAAHHSTGIAEVRAGQPISGLVVWLAPVLQWLAGWSLVRRLSARLSRARLPEEVSGRRSWAWAEARTATQRKAAVLELDEGYAFAARVMVRAAERIGELRAGAYTPASAFGPDFVLELGALRSDLPPERAGARPASFVDRLGQAPVVWTLFTLEALVLAVENGLTFPLSVPFMRATTGQVYLDFCAFCSSAEVFERVVAFGPIGRSLQLKLLPSIDVLIPVLSGLTGVAALRHYSRELGPRYRALLIVPVLAMLLDFAENAAIAGVVLSYPVQSGALGTLLGLLCGSKFIAYGAVCLCVLWVARARRNATHGLRGAKSNQAAFERS